MLETSLKFEDELQEYTKNSKLNPKLKSSRRYSPFQVDQKQKSIEHIFLQKLDLYGSLFVLLEEDLVPSKEGSNQGANYQIMQSILNPKEVARVLQHPRQCRLEFSVHLNVSVSTCLCFTHFMKMLTSQLRRHIQLRSYQ